MRKLKLFLFIFILVFMCPSESLAFWVWTPQTRGWVNPKYAAKATPQKQFDYAKGFFDKANYKNAAVQFERLINTYPTSSLAPEAGYYGGISYQKNEDFYRAFLIYKKILTQYPHSKRISQIIEQIYEVGDIFFEGRKRKLMGLEILPSLTTAEEIFKTIVDNVPYSEYGDKAQFRLGECYKRMGKYNQAIGAFEKLIKDYPKSSLADKVQYEIAVCSLAASLPSEYEQQTTDEAIEKFKGFIEESSSEELSNEAKNSLKQLEEKKAKHEYEIAEYYEKIHRYESAVIYYKSVIAKYPEAEWSKMAKERLSNIKERQESEKK